MRRGEGMVRGAAGGGRGPGLQSLRARNGSHGHYSKAYGAAEGFKPGSDVIQFELSWVDNGIKWKASAVPKRAVARPGLGHGLWGERCGHA